METIMNEIRNCELYLLADFTKRGGGDI